MDGGENHFIRPVRVISRLDVKMGSLIKGVQMEGWRKVGDPAEFAEKYFLEGADEILFMDVVASLYERNNLTEIVKDVAERVFVPLTVGGGVRSVEDVKSLLDVGADKVVINTAATQSPQLITDIADTYGAQATVVAIEAIQSGGGWQCMTDNGRNHTGLEAISWAKQAQERGAGELIVIGINNEGRGQGLDIDLVASIVDAVTIPVIAGGGVGSVSDITSAFSKTGCSAVSVAQALHYNKFDFSDVKTGLEQTGYRNRGTSP